MKTELTTIVFALSTLCASALPTTNQPPRAAIVEWNPPVGATPTNYVVYASTNHFWQGTNMVLNPVLAGQWNAGTALSVTTPAMFAVGSTYYFVATAQYTNGESAYSAEVFVTVTPVLLPPPTLQTTIRLVGAHDPLGPWEPLEYLAVFNWQPAYTDFDFLKVKVTINR